MKEDLLDVEEEENENIHNSDYKEDLIELEEEEKEEENEEEKEEEKDEEDEKEKEEGKEEGKEEEKEKEIEIKDNSQLKEDTNNFVHKKGFIKGYHYNLLTAYQKINPEKWYNSKIEFSLSKISKIYETKIKPILFCILYFISFYVLLIAYFLYKEIQLLIFSIIIYIIGTIAQMTIIPELFKFKTREQFEKDISKLLNSWICFKMYSGKGKKKITATFQAKYTIDVTGELIIPKGYNYARIKHIQIFASCFKIFIDNFIETYNSYSRELKLMYNDEEIYLPNGIYQLNSDNNNVYSINILTTILSILLCPWILSIYYNYSKEGKIIDIYLAKMLYEGKKHKGVEIILKSKSKVIIHNKKYKIKPYIINDIQPNYQFDKDFAIIENKKFEIERQNRDRAKNTKILSQWENGRNYFIQVKKVYDYVYLKFTSYEKTKSHIFNKKLGIYDPNIKEKIERSEKITTYYPKGYNIRIEVVRHISSYTVSIGDDDDEYLSDEYPFYSNS